MQFKGIFDYHSLFKSSIYFTLDQAITQTGYTMYANIYGVENSPKKIYALIG